MWRRRIVRKPCRGRQSRRGKTENCEPPAARRCGPSSPVTSSRLRKVRAPAFAGRGTPSACPSGGTLAVSPRAETEGLGRLEPERRAPGQPGGVYGPPRASGCDSGRRSRAARRMVPCRSGCSAPRCSRRAGPRLEQLRHATTPSLAAVERAGRDGSGAPSGARGSGRAPFRRHGGRSAPRSTRRRAERARERDHLGRRREAARQLAGVDAPAPAMKLSFRPCRARSAAKRFPTGDRAASARVPSEPPAVTCSRGPEEAAQRPVERAREPPGARAPVAVAARPRASSGSAAEAANSSQRVLEGGARRRRHDWSVVARRYPYGWRGERKVGLQAEHEAREPVRTAVGSTCP